MLPIPSAPRAGRLPIALCFVTLALSPLLSLHARGSQIVYAFRNFSKDRPEKMILIGEIRSKAKVAEIISSDSPFRGYDSRKDQVIVKVHDRQGIKAGQRLYVIDKDPNHSQFRNGLITGEIVVEALFHSPFYGWVITATGNLLRVREGSAVARTLDSENLEQAYILKKKGDHFANQGEIEKAIAAYHEAVEADRSLPEAYAALGMLYYGMDRLDGGVFPTRSLSEFQGAFRYRENFRYQRDRFQFYRVYMDALDRSYSILRLEGANKDGADRQLLRILEIGEEAIRIRPDDPDIGLSLFRARYHRMSLYRSQGSPDERKIYDDSKRRAGELLIRLADAPINNPEAHRIAALYTYRLYRDFSAAQTDMVDLIGQLYTSRVHSLYRTSRMIGPESDPKLRLAGIIRYHLELYRRYLDYGRERPDPEVESIRAEFL